MPMFKKKPVVIEARQFNGTAQSRDEVFTWMDKHGAEASSEPMNGITSLHVLVIPTLEGDHRASPGDWIIKGVRGEFYPCKPDIFAATYDPA